MSFDRHPSQVAAGLLDEALKHLTTLDWPAQSVGIANDQPVLTEEAREELLHKVRALIEDARAYYAGP